MLHFRHKYPGARRNGYTLVEMMVVIAVIGLIAAITLPAFGGYLRRTRMIGIRDQLIADMYYARSLAITNRRTIRMQFQAGEYRIVDTTDGAVLRRIDAPRGFAFAATADPNFYSWGLADATDVTLQGSSEAAQVTLMPTGAVDYE